ncbi:hypothetical protein C5167_049619 [Papaver somniferum]|uniref:Uncharacterized protein n=1 Tax=Papaver somniferum TaxID=3469 RepID=A0A4Y7KP71_PAPSO|nr:hypothetical protein C5167_049619 [Papaver somniferum]
MEVAVKKTHLLWLQNLVCPFVVIYLAYTLSMCDNGCMWRTKGII